MKRERLEEKLPDLVESPNEVGRDLPAKTEHQSDPQESTVVSFTARAYDFFLRLDKKWTEVDKRFEDMTPEGQEHYFERLGVIFCMTLSFILMSLFYWSLPSIVRVLVVPVIMGASIWLGAKVMPKLITSEGRSQIVQTLSVVEYLQLIEAIKFSAVTFICAAIPFWFLPSQFHVAMTNPMARTIFLCAFIWNLIGAPLYAQARSGKARLLIVLVFGLPAATVTLWWVNAIMLMRIFTKIFVGNS